MDRLSHQDVEIHKVNTFLLSIGMFPTTKKIVADKSWNKIRKMQVSMLSKDSNSSEQAPLYEIIILFG